MSRYPFLNRLRAAVQGNRPVDAATARLALGALEELADFVERLERRVAREQPDLCQILEETGLVPTEEVRRVIEARGTLRGPAPSIETEGDA